MVRAIGLSCRGAAIRCGLSYFGLYRRCVADGLEVAHEHYRDAQGHCWIKKVVVAHDDLDCAPRRDEERPPGQQEHADHPALHNALAPERDARPHGSTNEYDGTQAATQGGQDTRGSIRPKGALPINFLAVSYSADINRHGE